MQVKSTQANDTETILNITLDEQDLGDIKRVVLNKLRSQVKADGFRPGKAPDNIVEKQLGGEHVQAEVIEAAVNRFYVLAANQEKLRPLGPPEVSVKKFVPYTELEFEAAVEVVPPIKLPDYKKIKRSAKAVKVTDKDIDEVLERVRLQTAEKTEVKRAAKTTDEVWIDFEGKDSKGEAVKGASGKDYPLALGSGTFIPGFEEKLIGLKAGDTKTFDITFPKDYHVKSLAGAKVTFTVVINKINENKLPELNDEFAKKVSPLATIKELREDIRTQLQAEKEGEAQSELRREVIEAIVDKTKMKVPSKLADQVKEELRQDFARNLAYRGLTLEQYLEQTGQSEEEFESKEVAPNAEKRVKTSLVLTELAEAEKINVTPEELELRLQLLKNQYGKDEKMVAELDNPENRRDIASQLLTEKTIAQLVSYASK